VPNIKTGDTCIGGKIAPIFYSKAVNAVTGEVLATFQVKSEVLFDEVRAGGRISLIIGRGLTNLLKPDTSGRTPSPDEYLSFTLPMESSAVKFISALLIRANLRNISE
jgi:aconitase B